MRGIGRDMGDRGRGGYGGWIGGDIEVTGDTGRDREGSEGQGHIDQLAEMARTQLWRCCHQCWEGTVPAQPPPPRQGGGASPGRM